MTSEFEALFAREFATISRTAYLLCRDRQRAEEIAQDAFVEALRHWDRIASYDRPGAWVRRVAIRMALRGQRREGLRSIAERRSVGRNSVDPVDDREDVLRALRSLSRHQQVAVVLHYFEDLPTEQIADVIGCSPSTARVHLHRGRARLAELLKEVSDEPR